MSKKIMCNFAIEEETLQRLDAMASADMRNRTQEVNWLIEQAFKARAEKFQVMREVYKKEDKPEIARLIVADLATIEGPADNEQNQH